MKFSVNYENVIKQLNLNLRLETTYMLVYNLQKCVFQMPVLYQVCFNVILLIISCVLPKIGTSEFFKNASRGI